MGQWMVWSVHITLIDGSEGEGVRGGVGPASCVGDVVGQMWPELIA
jgi:hypothetical protein